MVVLSPSSYSRYEGVSAALPRKHPLRLSPQCLQPPAIGCHRELSFTRRRCRMACHLRSTTATITTESVGALICVFVILLLWAFRFTSVWVRISEDAYAERLAETVDSISSDSPSNKGRPKKERPECSPSLHLMSVMDSEPMPQRQADLPFSLTEDTTGSAGKFRGRAELDTTEKALELLSQACTLPKPVNVIQKTCRRCGELMKMNGMKTAPAGKPAMSQCLGTLMQVNIDTNTLTIKIDIPRI